MRARPRRRTYDYVNEIKMHLQHFVIADDLKYLRRGGRVGAASAAIGSMLNIKPVLTFDDAGKLVVIDKVKGTRKAIAFIKAKMEKEGPADPVHVFIVHTDNEPAARELEAYVKERFGIQPTSRSWAPSSVPTSVRTPLPSDISRNPGATRSETSDTTRSETSDAAHLKLRMRRILKISAKRL